MWQGTAPPRVSQQAHSGFSCDEFVAAMLPLLELERGAEVAAAQVR